MEGFGGFGGPGTSGALNDVYENGDFSLNMSILIFFHLVDWMVLLEASVSCLRALVQMVSGQICLSGFSGKRRFWSGIQKHEQVMMVPDSEVSGVRTSGTDESRMRCAKTANKDPTWIPSTSSASSLAVSVILSQKASVPQHQQEDVYAVLHRCHVEVM